MAWIGPAIQAGGALLGGLLGNSAQSAANAANIKMNKENREWMEKMSNTSYQRGTADMLKAGLNPSLAYSQGGASTPQNSAATIQPKMALPRGIGEAASAGMTALQAQNLDAQTQKVRADTEWVKAQTPGAIATSAATEERIQAEIANTREDTVRLAAQRDLTDTQRDQINRTIEELLPMYMANMANVKQQTQSAKTTQELNELEKPAKQAEADLWARLQEKGKALGWGAKLTREVLSIIQSVRGR